MAFYWHEFSNATVTPKLHMLEDHMVPWMQRWKVWFGLLDEQGAESIHAKFNTLKFMYCTILDRPKQLKQLMVEHYLHICPDNIALRPLLKKKLTSTTDTEE